MVVIDKERRLIIAHSATPEKIKTVIPSARTFTYKGRELLAIPHKLMECIQLHNLGIQVPSPILYYYNWPRSSKIPQPFQVQIDTAAFLTMNPAAFILNQIGTGKTLSMLWALDYLRSEGFIRKALISAPLSTLERTWGDEIFYNFNHLSFNILHGSKQRRIKKLHEDKDIYIINHDGTKVLKDELKKRDDIDLVAIDEVSMLRNRQADKWKIHHALVQKKLRWGATGTPIPEAPTDAYAQCKLINPTFAPSYFREFREATMMQISTYMWIPKPDALDKVYSMMQPSIRFTRDQCFDLPPVMHETKKADLTKQQSEMIKDLQNTMHAEFLNGEITAANEAVKLMKIVQFAGGVAYADDKKHYDIECKPRIDILKETIEQSDSKVIVFAPFTGMLDKLTAELSKRWTVERIDGSTTATKRNKVFGDFQNSDHPHIIVAHPQCMSHGLTLTAASTIIWYAPINRNEIYEQANGRITRPGQTRSQLIFHIYCTEIERRIYERLEKKQKTQGLLLDMYSANDVQLTT